MLTDLTIAQAREGLRAGEFSAVDLTLAHLHAIEALNPRLNAFITVCHAAAMDQARAADAALARGEARSLTGIPLAIKDLFCTEGVRTTAGSNILGPFVPPYESTVTSHLLRDGAIFLGKTNMDEFAMGSSNMTSALRPGGEPVEAAAGRQRRLVPGGSSGGSAAAVAARLAMGGDGDGYRRLDPPAGFVLRHCRDQADLWAVLALGRSGVRVVARPCRDRSRARWRIARSCWSSMAGHDPKDSTSADVPVPDFAAACARGVKGLRIGVPREYRSDGMPAEIEALWQQGVAWLRDAGAEIVDVSLPHTKYGLPTYYIVAPAEASSNLARYDGVRFGAACRRDRTCATCTNARARRDSAPRCSGVC